MLKDFKRMAWPNNLWSEIRQERTTTSDIQEDWEGILNVSLNTIPDIKKREILLCYFREHMTLEEIGTMYSLKIHNVRQILRYTVMQLRHMPAFGAISCADDNTPIDALGLSTRAYYCLRRAGISTVQELVQWSDDDILMIRNMGVVSYEEIKIALDRWKEESKPASK